MLCGKIESELFATGRIYILGWCNLSLRAKTFSFLKRVLTSRVGHLLLVINLCFIIYEYSQTSARFYESSGNCMTVGEAQNSDVMVCTSLFPLWVKIVALINLSALVPTTMISTFLQTSFPAMCMQTATQISTFLFAAFGSIQWLFVGYGIERIARKHFWK